MRKHLRKRVQRRSLQWEKCGEEIFPLSVYFHSSTLSSFKWVIENSFDLNHQTLFLKTCFPLNKKIKTHVEHVVELEFGLIWNFRCFQRLRDHHPNYYVNSRTWFAVCKKANMVAKRKITKRVFMRSSLLSVIANRFETWLLSFPNYFFIPRY